MSDETTTPAAEQTTETGTETAPTPTSGLWGAPAAQASRGPVKAGTVSNLPPHPSIRWSIWNDGVLALVLTLVGQIIIGMGVIFLWIAQNGEEIANLETAAAEEALTKYLVQGPGLLASALAMYAAWFYALRRASKKRGIGSYAKDFWLKFRLPRDIFLGLVLALVLRAVEMGVINGLAALGVDMSTAENSSLIMSSSGVWFFVNAIVTASILGPFMEEFLFRGLLLQGFLRLFRKVNRDRVQMQQLARVGVSDQNIALAENSATRFADKLTDAVFKARNWLAVIFSSAIFGFMHYQGWENFGQIFVVLWTGTLGAIFAIVVMRTKRLGVAIFAHIFFNFSGVMLAYFMR